MAWTIEQYSATDVTQDLGSTHTDLLHSMVWIVGAWSELDGETFRNAWRISNILPRDWNADIINLQEKVKNRIDTEIGELEKLIGSLDLGKSKDGNLIQKLSASDYIAMVDEDNTEGEYSTSEIIELVENGEISSPVLENHQEEDHEDEAVDKNNMERSTIQVVEARVAAQKCLDYMIGEGSSSFTCAELLQMERICDKFSKLCVAHVTCTKSSDIRSFMLND